MDIRHVLISQNFEGCHRKKCLVLFKYIFLYLTSSTSTILITSSSLGIWSGRDLLARCLRALARFPHTTPPDVSRLTELGSSVVLDSHISRVSISMSVRDSVLGNFLARGPLEAGLADCGLVGVNSLVSAWLDALGPDLVAQQSGSRLLVVRGGKVGWGGTARSIFRWGEIGATSSKLYLKLQSCLSESC